MILSVPAFHQNMPELITSPNNPLLKDVRRAVAQGGLTEDGFVVAESLHLVEEAVRSRRPLHAVLVCESAAALLRRIPIAARTLLVPDALFAGISSTETSRGVIALVSPPEWTDDSLFGPTPLVLALDGIQDPGNAGAMLRAAEAFGASGAILLRGTVGPWNPKAVRASAGSLFRLPLRAGCDPGALPRLASEHRCTLYAATPSAGLAIDQAPLAQPSIIIIGSEGSGVSEALAQAAQPLHIATRGVESLNAAMAATVILYESARQRSGTAAA